MGEIRYIKALALISLFAIAIISYSVGFANDNNSVISIDQDSDLSALNSNIQSNVTSFYLATGNSSESFFKSSITGDEQTTVTGGEFKLNLISMVNVMKGIFKSINKNVFGGSQALGFVLTLFTSLLIYIGVRYIWKTWKGGNPD